MHGSWVIVRTKRDSRGKASWLLIKHRDEGAVEGNKTGPTDDDASVASGRTMTEIANGKGKGKAATPFMTPKGGGGGLRLAEQPRRQRSGGPDCAHEGEGLGRQNEDGRHPAAFVEPQLTTETR